MGRNEGNMNSFERSSIENEIKRVKDKFKVHDLDGWAPGDPLVQQEDLIEIVLKTRKRISLLEKRLSSTYIKELEWRIRKLEDDLETHNNRFYGVIGPMVSRVSELEKGSNK